jgi:hypothetical protein
MRTVRESAVRRHEDGAILTRYANRAPGRVRCTTRHASCAYEGQVFHHAVFCREEDDTVQASSLQSAIQHQLARVGACSLDELVALLPEYSWAQVFAAADRLTREGTVTLKHQAPFRYLLSLAPRHSVEARPMTPI